MCACEQIKPNHLNNDREINEMNRTEKRHYKKLIAISIIKLNNSKRMKICVYLLNNNKQNQKKKINRISYL